MYIAARVLPVSQWPECHQYVAAIWIGDVSRVKVDRPCQFITVMNFFFTHTDVFGQGVWGTLKGLDDPDLLRPARELPSTVLQSRAISSSKKYTGAFRRWKQWALDHKLPVFPAKEQHVALYLRYIADVLKSKSAAEEAVHALNWVHSLAGLDSPAQSPLVQTTLEGLRRLLARPVLNKKPSVSGYIS